MKNKYQKMAFAILGKTLLFALLFITVCYGVLTFFADQSSLLENRPALVLGLLAAVLFFSLVFFVFRQIDLQMAINEIYARHGRIFGTESIQQYFEGKSWYQGTTDADHFSDSVFSSVENQNIQFLLKKMGLE